MQKHKTLPYGHCFPIRTRVLPQRSLSSSGTAPCCPGRPAQSQRTCGSGPCWTGDGGYPRPSPWGPSGPPPAAGPGAAWPGSGPWCWGSSGRRTDAHFESGCPWRAPPAGQDFGHMGFLCPARFPNARLRLQSSGPPTGTSGPLV